MDVSDQCVAWADASWAVLPWLSRISLVLRLADPIPNAASHNIFVRRVRSTNARSVGVSASVAAAIVAVAQAVA